MITVKFSSITDNTSDYSRRASWPSLTSGIKDYFKISSSPLPCTSPLQFKPNLWQCEFQTLKRQGSCSWQVQACPGNWAWLRTYHSHTFLPCTQTASSIISLLLSRLVAGPTHKWLNTKKQRWVSIVHVHSVSSLSRSVAAAKPMPKAGEQSSTLEGDG